jgi:RNA polymerase sigma factor (sigma-70 family)
MAYVGHTCFDDVYAAYESLVRRIVRNRLRDHELAEEAFNSTFARLSQLPERLTEAGDGIEAFITHIAIQTSIDVARREARELATPVDPIELRAVADQHAPLSVQPEVAVLRSELRSRVTGALRGINPDQRKLLYLHEVEGVAYEEIARSAGVSAKALRASAGRARQRLTHVLGAARNGVPGVVLGWSRRVRAQVENGADRLCQLAASGMAQPLLLATAVVVASSIPSSRSVAALPTATLASHSSSVGPTPPHAGRQIAPEPRGDGPHHTRLSPGSAANPRGPAMGNASIQTSSHVTVRAPDGSTPSDATDVGVNLPPCVLALPSLTCRIGPLPRR